MTKQAMARVASLPSLKELELYGNDSGAIP